MGIKNLAQFDNEPQLISRYRYAGNGACFSSSSGGLSILLSSPYFIYWVEAEWAAGNLPQIPSGVIRNPTILQVHLNTRFPASACQTHKI
jgi:hypothetical protein